MLSELVYLFVEAGISRNIPGRGNLKLEIRPEHENKDMRFAKQYNTFLCKQYFDIVFYDRNIYHSFL